MNEQQLERALAHLKLATVTPPLITDSDIVATRRRPFTTWLLLGLSLLMVGAWWLMSSQSPESAGLVLRDLGSKAVSTITDAPQALLPASPSEMNRSGATTLDPRSILVLSLTDEELAEFGITRRGDTVVVSIQSLVVEDPKIARTLGLDSTQLADTTLLFHWTSRSFPTQVDDISARSLDDDVLDHLSPIRVFSIKGDYIGRGSMVYPALVRKEHFDSNLTALLRATPSLYTAVAPETEYLAMLPSQSLQRDRKPIIVQVHTPGNEHRTQIEFMPTEDVLRRLPTRFRDKLSACYAAYHPPKPIKWQPAIFTPKPHIQLQRVNGIVGQPFLELDSAQLRPLGIMCDSVSIRIGYFGYTIDRSRTTMTTASRVRSDVPYLTQMLFVGDTTFRSNQISTLAIQNDVHCSGTVNSTRPGVKAMTYSISTRIEDDWTDRFPKAVEFVENVIRSAMVKGIPVDSLPFYWATEHNINLPIQRLLVGIRILTPWTTNPEWNGEYRRLEHINWYLPSQHVLNALPTSISSFLKPEFEALYASIEHELTMSEMCALLEKPSAFGLCSIADSTFRIDGIGPIPARESFTVFAHSATQMIATLKLISDDGRTVLERANITIYQGANQIPIPIANENIPAGAYTVVLTTSEGTRMSRVLVQR